MANKSPYEIRLDVLKIARDMYEDERQAAMREIESNNIATTADKTSLLTYSEADVTSRATSLYAFVKNNK